MCIRDRGYRAYLYSAQKKGYSGVAILTKQEPDHVEYGLSLIHIFGAGPDFQRIFESDGVEYGFAVVISVRTLLGNRAVSYTHLDVYKRQLQEQLCRMWVRHSLFMQPFRKINRCLSA